MISRGSVERTCGMVGARFSFAGIKSVSFPGWILSCPRPEIKGAYMASNPPKCLAKALRKALFVKPLKGAKSSTGLFTPAWFSFFDKSLQAFRAIGFKKAGEKFSFLFKGVFKAHRKAFACGFFCQFYGIWPIACNFFGHCDGSGNQLSGLKDLLHKSHSAGFVGINHLAGKHQIEAIGKAAATDDALRSPITGDDAQA